MIQSDKMKKEKRKKKKIERVFFFLKFNNRS